jgi:hypothetical protein
MNCVVGKREDHNHYICSFPEFTDKPEFSVTIFWHWGEDECTFEIKILIQGWIMHKGIVQLFAG